MIYITEFVPNSDINFSQTGESVLMVGQRLRCWPTHKSTIQKYSPIFQVSDIFHTGVTFQINPPDWTIPGYSLDYTLGIVWELSDYTPG